MKTLADVVISVGRVERRELMRWIEFGWVVPSRSSEVEAEFFFSDVDEARIRMICDLHHDLMIEEDAMPLVLSLLDQIYGLRHQMNALISAVQKQPDEVREAVLEQLKDTSTHHRSGG